MPNWFKDNFQPIGHTSMVGQNRITGGEFAAVSHNIEGRKSAFAVKCYIKTVMIDDAQRRRMLCSGKDLVEPATGYPGVALAYAAARSIPLMLMPDSGKSHLSNIHLKGYSLRKG